MLYVSGQISFTSHIPGEHTICLYSNTSHWFSGSQLRVHLDIQVGEHTVDYAQVAQQEKLTELQLRIRQLLNQVDQITKEQNYQRVSMQLLLTLPAFHIPYLSIRFFFLLVSRRTFPCNQRKHKQTCVMVVIGSSICFGWNGILANAPFENILRNKEISLNDFIPRKKKNPSTIQNFVIHFIL